MNRRYSTSRRKRKIEFLDRILELPEETDCSNLHALAESDTSHINAAGGNNGNSNGDGKEKTIQFKTVTPQPEELLTGFENDGRHGQDNELDENNNEFHDKDVRFYLNIFGLKPLSHSTGSASNNDGPMTFGTDNDYNKNATTENNYECMDAESLTGQADWDIVEIDVFGNSENFNDHDKPTQENRLEINSDVEESMEIETPVYNNDYNIAVDYHERTDLKNDINDNLDRDDDNEYDADDDCGDGDDDDDEDDYEVEGQAGNDREISCDEKHNVEQEPDKKTEITSFAATSVMKRCQERHENIEERIRKQIEEIEHKLVELKRKKHKRRKRHTKCNNESEPPPALNIEPIQRSKRLAEPIRHAILKRHVLRNALTGLKGSCCGKGCWSKWKWVNIRRVLSDYW